MDKRPVLLKLRYPVNGPMTVRFRIVPAEKTRIGGNGYGEFPYTDDNVMAFRCHVAGPVYLRAGSAQKPGAIVSRRTRGRRQRTGCHKQDHRPRAFIRISYRRCSGLSPRRRSFHCKKRCPRSGAMHPTPPNKSRCSIWRTSPSRSACSNGHLPPKKQTQRPIARGWSTARLSRSSSTARPLGCRAMSPGAT
jgi:hypothetical protein